MYASWEEVFETYGFDGDGGSFDEVSMPKAGCVVMPEVSVQSETMEPYFVWEESKVILVDEIADETKQVLVEEGWTVVSMETSPNTLLEILRGDA